MNGVNFNVVTPNVNFARLSDESTDKPTEQVSFKAHAYLPPEAQKKFTEHLEKIIKEYKRKKPIKYFFENLRLKIEGKRAAKRLIKALKTENKKEVNSFFKFNDEEKKIIENSRNNDEKREIITRISVSKLSEFFENLKNADKKRKEASRNQKVVDFASDAANYFEYKKQGRNIEADIYKERMRKFLEN